MATQARTIHHFECPSSPCQRSGTAYQGTSPDDAIRCHRCGGWCEYLYSYSVSDTSVPPVLPPVSLFPPLLPAVSPVASSSTLASTSYGQGPELDFTDHPPDRATCPTPMEGVGVDVAPELDEEVETETDRRIVSVTIQTNAGWHTESGGRLRQFVNLPASWPDRTLAPDPFRLGRQVVFRITFEGTPPFAYVFSVTSGLGSEEYTSGEQGRNPAFVLALDGAARDEIRGTTDATTVDVTVDLPVAGGNVYHGSASLQGSDEEEIENSVESVEIEVRRAIYFQTVARETAAVPGGLLGALQGFYDGISAGITVVPHKENLTAAAFDTASARAAGLALAKVCDPAPQPHTLIVAFVERLIEPNPAPTTWVSPEPVAIGPETEPVVLDLLGSTPGMIWPEPAIRWLQQGFLEPQEGEVQRIPIIDRGPLQRSGDFRQVRLDTATFFAHARAKNPAISAEGVRGPLTLKFLTLGSYAPGVSDPALNFIRIGKSDARGQAISEQRMLLTLVHEIGHKLGLVPDGAGRGGGLDKGPYQYAKGGSHCAAMDKGEDGGFTCLMYEQENGSEAFCEACGSALRKADLGAGFGTLSGT